jgi:ppGpp synthetase/RelA/SpoT-type nucleotidyltranferase
MTTPFARIGTSRREVDLAGDLLRDWMNEGLLLGPGETAAMDLLESYRAQFTEPLTKVVMGLRSAVRSEGAPIVVAQRLKRQPRIIGKLIRFPSMNLSQMQDIGGCRAILPDLASVEAVRRRLMRHKSEVIGIDDYNAVPKSSGYRALHVVVRRDMALIEIQLRTPWQQQWATLVEDIDGALRLTLKDDSGPNELLRYLRALAYAQWESYGLGKLTAASGAELRIARSDADRWLMGREATS